MKEVIKVVLLDELKSKLTAYEEPLKDLRDSLWPPFQGRGGGGGKET